MAAPALQSDLEDVKGSIHKTGQSGTSSEDNDRQNVEKQEEEKCIRKSAEKLWEVWSNFLGETSLHGCKNLKEKAVAKRLVWCCLLLLMAASLSWALLNLFLKYQQHPFVSVWGFQKEGTILAPGITICLPSRFNKKKFEASRPAYQLLAYEPAQSWLFDILKRDQDNMENLTDQFKMWETELENVTMRQAQRGIGFLKKEVFPHARLVLENEEVDIINKMVETNMEASICWWVNWLLPDQTVSGSDDNDSLDDSSESENSTVSQGDIVNSPETTYATSITHHNGSINITSPEPGVNGTAANNTLDWSSFVRETLLSNQSHLVSTLAPSQPPDQPNRNTPTITDTPENGGHTQAQPGAMKETGAKEEMRARGKMNSGFGSSELLRLSPRDSVTLTVNLQQENWLGDALMAGVDLFLHGPVGGYSSQRRILLRPGTFNLIEYTATNYKFLPSPYKSFSGVKGAGVSSRNAECVDTKSSGFQNPLVSIPRPHYSSDVCMHELAINKSTHWCGCGIDRFFNTLHGAPMCSVLQHTRCYKKAFEREYNLMLSQQASEDVSHQLCPSACEYTTFEHSTSSADFPAVTTRQLLASAFGMEEEMVSKNILVIQIQPQGPLSVSVEHVPELTVLGILGSVGGWMGLCLGASLLTLFEFFEAAAMSVWILYRKLMYRLRLHEHGYDERSGLEKIAEEARQ